MADERSRGSGCGKAAIISLLVVVVVFGLVVGICGMMLSDFMR